MTTPTPVVIVRHKKSARELVELLLASVFGLFFNAWIVMVLVVAVTPWNFSYWQTLGIVLLLNYLQKSGTAPWLLYTRDADR